MIRPTIFALVSFLLTATNALAAATTDGRLQNPLNDEFSSVPAFIAGLMKVVVMFGMPLVALALVYSGFMFAKARGNSTELGKAKDNFKYTMLGAALIMGAWVFAMMLWGTVGQLINSGGGGNQAPTPGLRAGELRV